MSNPAPSQIEIAIYKASYDGQYWGRYPNGDKPGPGMFANAAAGVAVAADLKVGKPLSGSASASVSASASLTTGGGGHKKVWNPDVYMDTNTIIFRGQTAASRIGGELSVCKSTVGCAGHLSFLTWSAIETAKDVYTSAVLDEIYNTLAPAGKRMLTTIDVGANSQTHPGTNDASILPLYLQQDPATYGQAGYRVAGVTTQPAGVSGWWGGDGNGNTYCAQLHRASVMARYIKMMQFIAAWAANKPLFEGIIIHENSFWIGSNSGNGGGSGYSDTLATQTQTSLIQALQAAFTTANCWYQNTFMQTVTPCQQLTSTICQNGVTPGQIDEYGHMWFWRSTASTPGNVFGWGQTAYCNQRISGSTATLQDWRGQGVRFLTEIQAPDLGAYNGIAGGSVPISMNPISATATSATVSSSFQPCPTDPPGYWPPGIYYTVRFSATGQAANRQCTVTRSGGITTFTWTGALGFVPTSVTVSMGGSNGFSPQDMCDAAIQDLNCSHIIYTYIPDNSTIVPIDRRWTQGFAVLVANKSRINTAYPTNLPQ